MIGTTLLTRLATCFMVRDTPLRALWTQEAIRSNDLISTELKNVRARSMKKTNLALLVCASSLSWGSLASGNLDGLVCGDASCVIMLGPEAKEGVCLRRRAELGGDAKLLDGGVLVSESVPSPFFELEIASNFSRLPCSSPELIYLRASETGELGVGFARRALNALGLAIETSEKEVPGNGVFDSPETRECVMDGSRLITQFKSTSSTEPGLLKYEGYMTTCSDRRLASVRVVERIGAKEQAFVVSIEMRDVE